MGNAQSNNGNGANKSHPSSPATHDKDKKQPLRKDSIHAVAIKSSPTTGQDNGLLLHADSSTARGVAPSTVTATEKLLDITGSSVPKHVGTTRLELVDDVAESPKPVATSSEKTNITTSGFDSPAPATTSEKSSLRRRNSFGSGTTVDTVDDDELNIDDSRSIPTTIVWPHEARKVYVTGTFSGWKKKFKLVQSQGQFSTIVNLPPGTHHLKFLVDGQMRTSDAIPTAVDAAGILVNYIEVNADDMPPLSRQVSRQSIHHHETTASGIAEGQRGSFEVEQSKSAKKYTSVIPSFLEDLEERQERYGRDFSTLLPPPPSLPMILSKVILNGNTTIKDDSSVLGIPNHVVLNHLATSSIKNHVLAISATTRYKKKYVSTILYKSTSATE